MALQDDASFLDAIPLRRLSVQSGDVDLDGFDFLLDDGEDEPMGSNSSTHSNSSDMIDALLHHQQDESNFDPTFDNQQDLYYSSNNNSSPSHHHRRRRTKRERSASPQQLRMNHNSLNFDAPSRRQSMSHNDLSPYATMAAASSSPSSNAPTGISGSQYTDALKSLAQSMKQTAESREYMVKMKREYLTPAQQAALASAKEQLQRQNEAVVQARASHNVSDTHHVQQQQQQVNVVSSAPSSAFPSWGIGTGLVEQSRKSFGVYMNQMNQQTL